MSHSEDLRLSLVTNFKARAFDCLNCRLLRLRVMAVYSESQALIRSFVALFLYFVFFFLQTVKLADGCQWTDNLVELQMWSRLSVLAFNAENHSLVLHCGQRAVAFAESDKCLAKRNPKKPDG